MILARTYSGHGFSNQRSESIADPRVFEDVEIPIQLNKDLV